MRLLLFLTPLIIVALLSCSEFEQEDWSDILKNAGYGDDSSSSRDKSSSSSEDQSSSSSTKKSSSSSKESSSSSQISSSSSVLSSLFECSNPELKTYMNGKTEGSCSIGTNDYPIVRINIASISYNRIWMAQNLNENKTGSLCYDKNSANCNEYGRLYDWTTATTACPNGWKLPTESEFQPFLYNIPNPNLHNAYIFLTKPDGFKALPGGRAINSNAFMDKDITGYWWTSMENQSVSLKIDFNNDIAEFARDLNKTYGFSVRCIMNN